MQLLPRRSQRKPASQTCKGLVCWSQDPYPRPEKKANEGFNTDSPNHSWRKCMSNIVRTDSWISIYWSKLSDAKFSILYYISFGQRLRRENLLWSLLRLMFFKVQQLPYSFIISTIKRNHYKWHMKISKWIKYWKMASLKIANLLKAVILWMVVNGTPCLSTIQNIKLQF